MSKTAKAICPQCGQSLPANSPAGLCPNCLMAMNMATQTEMPGGIHTGSPPGNVTPSAPADITKFFPNFEILEFLGRGGMGMVYKARQKSLNRIVALKILAPEREKDAAFAQRFALEAETLAKLNHPGVVTIYDFGQTEGLFYLVMEFVDGVTLRRLLEGGRIAPREALAIVPQICDALQYAHDQGIVHRDIKPENILLDRRGRVKVADFGLAKLIEQTAEPAMAHPGTADGGGALTGTGKVMGTPSYMAPEQIQNPADVDHRADIYALGVVLYQMLTGELPDRQLEPPSKKVRIDVRLDEVVLQALERNPQRRYQQASQVKTAVENIMNNLDFEPEPKSVAREELQPSPPDRVTGPPRKKQNWLYAFGAGVLAVLVLEFALVAFHDSNPTAMFVGLLGGGLAFMLVLLARKQWLGGFLVCIGFALCFWLAAAALAEGPVTLSIIAAAAAVAMLILILKKCSFPPGFIGAFVTVHLLVFGASGLITFIMPESFVSTARVVLESEPINPLAGQALQSSALSYDPYFVQTEVQIISSEVILARVVQRLNLASNWGLRFGEGGPMKAQEALAILRRSTDVRPVRNSNVVEIRVFSDKADEAAIIANEIAKDYQDYHHAAGAFNVKVELVDVAQPGLRPVRPNKPMNLAIGALAGLLLGSLVGIAKANRLAASA